MAKEKIMIVEDSFLLASKIKETLQNLDYSISSIVDSGEEAIKKAKGDRPDLVLMDIGLKGEMDGIEAAQKIKLSCNIPVIYLTAFSDESVLKRARITEPFGYIVKPYQDRELYSNIEMALYKSRIEAEKQALKQEVSRLHSFVDSSLEKTLGVSKALNEIHNEIQKVANSDFSIIIQGETGVGKTTLARQIHELSKRSDKPFVKVDIGTLSESLIESELFGHEKGAFTGADRKKKGFFEVTDGGTIFIDEIENMSRSTQSKLLNVIEEKKIYLVGSSKPIKVDFRTISASNTKIDELVREKKIRQDIYYRLAEYVITLPPLRERHEDILFFARKFLAEAVDELNQPIKGMSDEVMGILTHYPWPGNIRELKNVIKKLVLFANDGVITGKLVSTIIQDKSIKSDSIFDMSLKNALKAYEKNMIKSALKNAKGNKSRAASILQTSYRNLLTKINEYGI